MNDNSGEDMWILLFIGSLIVIPAYIIWLVWHNSTHEGDDNV